MTTHYDDLYADLACGARVEPADRERALRHALECARCRLRLDDERALSSGLEEVRREDADAEAPRHVRAAAIAAMRAQASAPSARHVRRRSAWLAVAAALVVAAGAGVAWLASRPIAPATAANTPGPISDVPPHVMPPPPSSGGVEPAGGRTRPSKQGTTRAPRRPVRAATTPAPQTETTTDYIPLTYVDDATAMESGHVVRVEVPRETLASFGIPASDSSQYVKADVVIGDDGVARAIRFVK